MQARVEEHRRDTSLKEWPLIATSEEIREVIVVVLLDVQAKGGIGPFDCLGERPAAAMAQEVDRITV